MRDEKGEGGWAGEGEPAPEGWGEQIMLSLQPVLPLGGPNPCLSAKAPSPCQGQILGLPGRPANSPAFATAFFSFCSFLKLPFKCF